MPETVGKKCLMRSQRVIKVNLKRFCHNLEGSFPDRPPSKSKIQFEKRTIKIGELEHKSVQIVHCAEA